MLERISISEPKYAELQQNTANELHEFHAASVNTGTHGMSLWY